MRDAFRFLGALLAAVVLLLLLVFRVTSCAPAQKAQAPPAGIPGRTAESRTDPPGCESPAWRAAAQANASALRGKVWSPFGRTEIGWETYAPLIQTEVGTACPPDTEGFAAAFAAWQDRKSLPVDGVLDEADFQFVKAEVQTRRAVVNLAAQGICPDTANEIAAARPHEGYMNKQVWLRPGALAAYRRMVAEARQVPEIAADPRNLTIFSGYRSPAADAARCATEGNCDGIARARCSPHRTGLAMDIYVGQAPGYGPDSSADPNRLFMSKTPTYRWLLANAGRFGFVNYPFEPWHWEWTGEKP
ncbi:M15 family metallopeptidase [Phenylobacterium sp. J426]|uniref:M15 family metallopeptidase n=1 Tax=Phenylobacterium sp. J426 TaxID=2898439 RepID=UPI0021516C52|nr:M15 family metallopeptidase [Phenylobacterium sp. J426]MCR5874328.1 M15 family metallopeptidase [Phenylobacterium sp. J426]